jgi:hypothetical protein
VNLELLSWHESGLSSYVANVGLRLVFINSAE